MSDIPNAELSARLADLLAGRRVVSAVFLTYRFDAGFFESEVLPVVFEVECPALPLRLARLEEAIGEVAGRVAVYYDHGGLEVGDRSAQLDFQRVPLVKPMGVFHPKLVLLLCERREVDDEGPAQELLVGCLSANLTRAGWWENVEVAHFERIEQGQSTRMREQLLKAAGWLRRTAAAGTDHAALQTIREFLLDTRPRKRRSDGGELHTTLYCTGSEPVLEFLRATLGRRMQGCFLEVLSPYFDQYEKSLPLAELIRAFEPAETRVYLPLDEAGRAGVSRHIHERVPAMGEGICVVHWGRLPDKLLRRGAAADAGKRFMHAKVYRFFRPRSRGVPRAEVFFVGSVNLTRAAHSGENNFEIGVLVENNSLERDPEFWLARDRTQPNEFQHESETGDSDSASVVPLLVRYHWGEGTAKLWWESRTPSPELHLDLNGVALCSVPPLPAREWRSLDPAAAERLGRHLEHSSFLGVRGAAPESSIVLVQEEGMAHKPSLVSRLTGREIIEYWALLTARERERFLEKRLAAEVALGSESELRPRRPPDPPSDSLFDRFAGIFHSFSCAESRVLEQLGAGNEREAEYRLFGRKSDSLGELIDRVFDPDEGWDDVQRYVVLLCARQLCDQVKRHENGEPFWLSHPKDVARLEERLGRVAELRERLVAANDAGMTEFLDWFEPHFVKRAPAREVSA